jgi:hypothetical protein
MSSKLGMAGSHDVLLQPLFPVLLCEAARNAWFIETLQLILVYTYISSDCFICAYIEQNSRRDVNTNQTTSLDEQLEIIGHLIARVQTSIRTRLIGDLKLIVNLALIQTNTSSKFGKSLVSLVSGLIDDIDVEVFGLLVKEGSGEGPELGRIGLQYCNGGFVDERG